MGIKAEDLRVGNWVEKDGEEFIATAYTILLVERGQIKVTAVPLREDILGTFGFERRGYTSSLGKMALYHKESMYPDGRVYFNSLAILEQIPEYTHELQNLWKALTNTELTIK